MYETGYSDGGAAFGAFMWLFFAALYLYFSYALMRIAKKCGHDSEAWWAFVPILNTFLVIKCAAREWYWFLFLLIPIVNIIAFFVLWADLAKAVGKHWAWGVLTMLFPLSLISIGVLAFSAPPTRYTPPRTPSPRQPVGV